MKTKYDAEDAVPVAMEMVERLSPFCERIEIAGSLRRQNEQVGYIELLYIPRLETLQAGLFDTEPFNLAEEQIGKLLSSGVLEKRPNEKGHTSWGAQNKLGIHANSGIPIDLFSTTKEKWWVAMVIRTGSKETNLSLTNGAIALGRTLNAYGVGVTESDGSVIQATSEEHVFELCGVEYKEPHRR